MMFYKAYGAINSSYAQIRAGYISGSISRATRCRVNPCEHQVQCGIGCMNAACAYMRGLNYNPAFAPLPAYYTHENKWCWAQYHLLYFGHQQLRYQYCKS